jgi:hypothetical protein
MSLAVVIMTCVSHILELKHGQDQLDIRLLMNGDLGLSMMKLQGIASFSYPT